VRKFDNLAYTLPLAIRSW